WQCTQAGIQLQDLAPSSARVLIANNSLFGNHAAFRVWDDPPYKNVQQDQVEFRNNMLFDSQLGDMVYVRGLAGGNGMNSQEDSKSASELWRFDHNFRDLTGTEPAFPLCRGDVKLEKPQLLSRDLSHADFLRPAADSPLATGGAGKEDTSLPIYV